MVTVNYTVACARKQVISRFRRRGGVKLIGATAHYVTEDLDEGPIIEQQVARVDHSMSTADVTMLGRDTECMALSRAVRWHTENRILLDGRRTVIFP